MKCEKYIKAVTVLLCTVLSFLLSGCKGDVEVSWKVENHPVKKVLPVLKVYIENSGSMDGYMCEGSELKDAVYDYASSVSSYSSATYLSYINSQVVPYEGSLRSFVRDLTPSAFRAVSGNRANSDLGDMLQRILAATDKNTVSIFISDCILDVPQGKASNYFINRQIDLKNAFLKKLVKDSNFGVEIIQLESRFTGNYYGTDGTTSLTNEQRPYYIWVMGDKKVLAYLNRHIALSKIKHGYRNIASFATCSDISYDLFNSYLKGVENNRDGAKKMSLKSVRGGDYELTIKVDLYPTLIDDVTLAKPSIFKTKNDFVKVMRVEPIEDESYSHLLTVRIESCAKSSGEILRLVPQPVPLWVEQSNDKTGMNIRRNLNKTSGIKYIVGGIADAYSEQKERANIKFTIKE